MDDVNIFDLVKNDFNTFYDKDLVGKKISKSISGSKFKLFSNKDSKILKKR